MYISELRKDEDHKPATEFLTEERRKAMKRAVEEMVDDEFQRLEDYANDYITDVAARRAHDFLEAVLRGDENAATRLIGGTYADRYRKGGCDDGKPWASMIHGNLFTTQAVEIRRKIVEAHADLLRNARIADLEAVVDGLQQQIANQDAEIQRLRDNAF